MIRPGLHLAERSGHEAAVFDHPALVGPADGDWCRRSSLMVAESTENARARRKLAGM